MDNPVEGEVEVIESDNSEEEDDVNLTMDAVPFQEKVEKWLMSCNGAKSKISVIEDAGSVFQEKIVVVKEVIDQTESLHSVDTEQYIKSNRRKTTTKVTTTTIKKYYSMKKVAKNVVYNNNGNGYSDEQVPCPAIDLATSEKEKYSCKVNRKSPRKAAKNLPSVPEVNEVKSNRTKRNRQSHTSNVDNNVFTDLDDLNQVPFTDQNNKCHDVRGSSFRKSRKPYNTRLNDEVNNKIRLCSKLCKSLKKPKRRVPVTVKQRGSYVKLEPLSHCTITNSLSAKARKKNVGNPKLKGGSVRNPVSFERLSSDSEQDDILLTSYKPFSLAP